jgi:hypothetical protein
MGDIRRVGIVGELWAISVDCANKDCYVVTDSAERHQLPPGVSVNDAVLSGKNLPQVTTSLASLALPKRELTVLTG